MSVKKVKMESLSDKLYGTSVREDKVVKEENKEARKKRVKEGRSISKKVTK